MARALVRPAVPFELPLRARTEELAKRVLDRWEVGRGDPSPVTDRVREDVLRFCNSGTGQVTHYLITGEAPTREQTTTQAAPGRAAANQSVSLADLLKMHLFWRDVTIDLTSFAGQTVQLQLMNKNTGWFYEWGFWDRIAVVTSR